MKRKEQQYGSDIGLRLAALRVKQELSQGDVEQRCGLLRCYVSRVEHGHTIPRADTLGRWLTAMGMKWADLDSAI